MKQKILIEIEATEIQKALETNIENIIKHDLRDFVDERVNNIIDDIIKAKINDGLSDRINSRINDRVRYAMGCNSDIMEKVKEIISKAAFEAFVDTNKENIISKLLEVSNYKISNLIAKEVENHIRNITNENLNKTVSKIIADKLLK